MSSSLFQVWDLVMHKTDTYFVDFYREIYSIYIEKIISIINQSVGIFWVITSKVLPENINHIILEQIMHY